jgi:chromosome segregation ATPase
MGMVRARSYDTLAEQQKKAEARASRLEQQLEDARAGSRTWKTKADAADSALKKLQEQDAAIRKRLEHVDKLRVESEKRARVNEERTAELAELQKRLVDSERELAIAREQLMAIEVKLDILEGAANVLDSRTRPLFTAHGKDGTSL